MRAPRPPKPADIPPNPRSRRKPDDPLDLTAWSDAAFGGAPIGSFAEPAMDDTSAVIMATTSFERLLAFFIVMHAGEIPKTKQMDSIFRYPGPLSSFSSKIELCHLMGHLTDEMRHDLNIVRVIRNAFCHSQRKRSFSDPDISARCNSFKGHGLTSEQLNDLSALEQVYGSRAKGLFVLVGLGITLQTVLFVHKRMAEINMIEANKAAIVKTTLERFQVFRDRIDARFQAALGQASAPLPPGSTSPEKILEELSPPPPASRA